jgi:hypothetical protein
MSDHNNPGTVSPADTVVGKGIIENVDPAGPVVGQGD